MSDQSRARGGERSSPRAASVDSCVDEEAERLWLCSGSKKLSLGPAPTRRRRGRQQRLPAQLGAEACMESARTTSSATAPVQRCSSRGVGEEKEIGRRRREAGRERARVP
jgi:hypothetical protein